MTTAAIDIAHEEEYLGKLDWRLWTKILRRAMAYRTSIVLLLVTAAVMAGVDALYPLVTRGLIDDIEAGMTEAPAGYEVEPDRKEAIHKALQRVQPDDVLLIAGKGHEDYQDINGVKYPFDDREIAREFLRELGGVR